MCTWICIPCVRCVLSSRVVCRSRYAWFFCSLVSFGLTFVFSYLTRCVARLNGPNTKDFFTAVTPHNPSISGLPHDHPSSVARQQRKKTDPWPPQAARALKIALLGAHAEGGPRGALEELRHSTLLLRPLSVLCSSHLQVVPMLCGGIEQHVCSPIHNEILVHK